MFVLTREAADQVRHSLEAGNMRGLALRIAATRTPDGGLNYRMGFDEIGEGDTHLTSEGIDVVIAASDKELLQGTVMDYVEIEPDNFRFVFLNPNDPNYSPPTET